MKKQFDDINLRGDSLERIETINLILENYARQGFDLTLRQLYYQLVSRDIIPNNLKSYNRLGDVVNKGRLVGLIDWDMIVDRGRSTNWGAHWESPAEIVNAAANQFRIDKWEDQPWHVEVFVEKQALEGVLIPTCERLDVRFTANKGYSSQSFMYRKGVALREKIDEGKEIAILYLGDHDPSGLDMDRDVLERLAAFARVEVDDLTFERLALTREQIRQYTPPPNPAKITDSRAGRYIAKHGRVSWELDALEPRVLAKLVSDAVLKFRDEDRWDAAVKRERKMRDDLKAFARDYR